MRHEHTSTSEKHPFEIATTHQQSVAQATSCSQSPVAAHCATATGSYRRPRQPRAGSNRRHSTSCCTASSTPCRHGLPSTTACSSRRREPRRARTRNPGCTLSCHQGPEWMHFHSGPCFVSIALKVTDTGGGRFYEHYQNRRHRRLGGL